MKLVSFFLPLLLMTLTAQAQMSFSPIGTTYEYSGGGWPGNSQYENIYSEKDTVIKGISHRKLIYNGVIKEPMRSESRLYKGGFLMRQSNDSIFFDDKLAYYLGAKEKDSIKISSGSRPNYLILDSIRYKEYFSASRKIFFFRQTEEGCQFTRKVTFVENYGPVDAYILPDIMYECYITNLPNLTYDCGFFEGVPFRKECIPLSILSPNSISNLFLYPNPVTLR